MRLNILSLLVSLFFSFILGKLCIPILKRFKAGQPILGYVKEHKYKSGTPTMGGVFFIIPTAITYFSFFGFKNGLANVAIAIGLSFMCVGLIDDFIKIKFNKNEGLKPYQKIVFQLFISAFAGLYVYVNSLTEFYIPFFKGTVNLGVFTVFLIVFVFLAITNCVNLTDGLDGLAGTTSVCYLFVLAVIIILEKPFSPFYDIFLKEFDALISLSGILIGGILGFLIFNVNKAKIFMGDTGSLSLGGFIGAISVFSLNTFFVPVIGIMFVVSGISVILQVAYFKRTRKRVFLMAPFHHHLQMKGKTEAQISYYYALITMFLGLTAVLFYL